MSKITKEVKIGIAFVIALCILYFGINFLKGINIFKPANSYTISFNDVSGLLTADGVTVNGLKIGQVFDMQLNPEDPSTVLVNIHLDKGFKIPVGSKVMLEQGMIASSNIIIEPNKEASEYYTSDDIIAGEKKTGLMDAAANIVPKLEGMIPKLDSILTNINKLTGDTALTKTLKNVNTITDELAVSSRQVNVLLSSLGKDLPIISKNLANTTENVAQITQQVKGIDIASTFRKLDSTMSNIEVLSSKLNSKDNSIGLLLNDRKLYDDLNSTLGNASLLLEDVKNNPSKYINVKVF